MGTLQGENAKFNGAVEVNCILKVMNGATVLGTLQGEDATFSGAVTIDKMLYANGGVTAHTLKVNSSADFYGVVTTHQTLIANGGIQITTLSAATGTFSAGLSAPTLKAEGTATNVALYLSGKGAGNIIAKSAISFDALAQKVDNTSCSGMPIGSITSNAAGDILVCRI